MTEARATLRVPEAFFDGGCIADAFHGTLERSAQGIAEKGFRSSAEAGQHYGPGVYFFESDYFAACWFANHRRREVASNDRLAVVQATVNLGRTFYANAITVEVEKARRELGKQLGTEVPPMVVFRLVGNKLREQKLIDSVKVVRHRTKPKPEPDSYRTEIVLLVFESKKIESRVKVRHPREFGRSRTVQVTLEF